MYVGAGGEETRNYMVQEWLNMQGFFSTKITPMGAKLVLMEEMGEGIIPAFILNASDWVYEIFEDVHGWGPLEVDNKRVGWVRGHGILAHAWNTILFILN